MTELMGTAAQEAVRIADTYLPRGSWQRRKALALEIVKAIELCERELGEEIIRKFKTGAVNP